MQLLLRLWLYMKAECDQGCGRYYRTLKMHAANGVVHSPGNDCHSTAIEGYKHPLMQGHREAAVDAQVQHTTSKRCRVAQGALQCTGQYVLHATLPNTEFPHMPFAVGRSDTKSKQRGFSDATIEDMHIANTIVLPWQPFQSFTLPARTERQSHEIEGSRTNKEESQY